VAGDREGGELMPGDLRKTIVVMRCPPGTERSAFVASLLEAGARAEDRVEIEIADEHDSRLRDDLRKRSQPPGRCRFDAVVQWWHEPGVAFPLDRDGLVATYEVDEVVQWTDPSPTLGFSQIAFLCKKDTLDAAQFRQRYIGHGAIARPAHPKMVEYMQNFVTAHHGESPCDAIAFLRFATYESYRDHFFAGEEHIRAVSADMSQTSSREKGWALVGEPALRAR
jgi:hypothetical protein